MSRSLCLIALVVLGLPLASFGFDVDSLLKISVGGDAGLETVSTMRSYRAVGAVEFNGLAGRFEEIVAPPNRLMLRLHFPQFSMTQAFDGIEAWQQDVNGRISTLSGFERAELLRSLYFEGFAHVVPDRFPGSYEYWGDTTIQGESLKLVRFFPLDADTMIVGYNATTGMRRVTFSRMDDLLTVMTNDQYQNVEGVPIAMRQTGITIGAPIEITMRIDTAAFNLDVDTTIFTRPDIASQVRPFPSADGYVELPFDYVNGHILVVATLNGKKRVRLILDSGASATLLNSATTQDLEMPEVGRMPARGVAGFQEVALVRIDSIALGELTLYSQIGGFTDLGMLATSPDELPIGGVIGYNFLSQFPILIDYQRSLLIVYDPAKFEPPTARISIPFDLTMQVPTVKATIGGVEGEFLVDLGNALGLIVHEQFATENKFDELFSATASDDRIIGGVGGKMRGRAYVAPEFTVGDLKLTDIPVLVAESSQGITGSRQIDGNIGSGVFRTYHVVFDYQRHQLYLLPLAD